MTKTKTKPEVAPEDQAPPVTATPIAELAETVSGGDARGENVPTPEPAADLGDAPAEDQAPPEPPADAVAPDAAPEVQGETEAPSPEDPAPTAVRTSWPEVRYLTDQVTLLNHDGPRDGFVEDIRTRHGGTVQKDLAQETVQISIQGITGEPGPTLHIALENWANAARRALLDRTGRPDSEEAAA